MNEVESLKGKIRRLEKKLMFFMLGFILILGLFGGLFICFSLVIDLIGLFVCSIIIVVILFFIGVFIAKKELWDKIKLEKNNLKELKEK